MIKLIAIGDIFLKTKDNADPFRNIKELLYDHDIVFGNLETVLSKRGSPIEKRVLLRTNPKNVNYIKNAGINIVNLATNHIMDYGEEGLIDTISILKENNIEFIGAGKDIKEATNTVIFNKNGLRIGFVGSTAFGIMAGKNNSGCAPLNREAIIECILELRKKVDILVVSLHWGIEYVFYPSPEQQKLARTLIDNGVDLIIGHHPHVIQGIEKYKKGLIIYSLGNCNFGVEQDKNYNGADIGLIVSVNFSNKGIIDHKTIPIGINSNYTPVLLDGKKKLEVLEFIGKISAPLQTEITPFFWYKEASTVYLPSQIESYFIRIKRHGVKHLYFFIRWLLTPFVFKMVGGYIVNEIENLSLLKRNK